MSENLKSFFMPFTDVQYARDVPLLTYVFEGQEDAQISEHFPELEARRKAADKVIRKGDDATVIQSLVREDKIFTAGAVYIRYPWKKRKELDWGSLIFFREVARYTVVAVKRIREEGFKKLTVILPDRFSPHKIQDRNQYQQLYLFIKTIAESIISANGSYDKYVSQPDKKLEEVTFVHFGNSMPKIDGLLKKAMSDGISAGEALTFTKVLIETPPNLQSPIEFVRQAIGKDIRPGRKNIWHKFSVSPCIKGKLLFGSDALKTQGFELINGVGVGSNNEPCLLQLHYRPQTKRKRRVKKVVLTGKGVVFDAGGLDLKGTGYYDKMHFDMAGAATVVGVMRLAERERLPVELVGLMPLVENSIGQKSIQPGSILKAYGGNTVEILNTDCEGRLLMAEAIAYADKKIASDAVITVATLADMKDFGPDLLRVVVSNRSLEKKVRVAERLSSEKMILFPPIEHLNHVDEMHIGRTTDLVNDVPDCYFVSPIVFMYNFFSSEPVNWALVDISTIMDPWAPEYGAGPGFGLKFLWHFIQQFA